MADRPPTNDKPQTHGHIIRFAPPLVISDEELQQGIDVICDATRAMFKQ